MNNALIILICFFGFAASSQNYKPVDEGSKVGFTIKNFGIATGGSFKGLKGTITFNPADIATVVFNITVDANTINTGINARDNHLRKNEYFAAETYPLLSFVSTKVIVTDKPEILMVHGKLTIKGVTKEIFFPFMAQQKMEGYLFAAMFKINRRDFNVGGGSLIISDNLNVSLSVFAKKI